MTKVFCYPKLGRSGLGNCMLPWARAVVSARKNSWPILAPSWVQPRLGSVLRREKVKRFYFNDFTNQGYTAGLKKWIILNRARKVDEGQADSLPREAGEAGHRPTAIVFEGLKNYFRDIWHDHGMVRDELLKIVSPRILESLALVDGPFVAMHVRRGDTYVPGLPEERLLVNKHYTPLSWFTAAARDLRQEAGWRDVPIYVFSDGHPHELAELLACPNCRLMTTGAAIGDILALAKARLLFGSGHSTFSMWGSYLGRVPTLYYPGKMTQNVFPPEGGLFEGEWNGEHPLPKQLTI